MTVIAIDAGTSTIKAAAFDRSGRELFVARRESIVERPREGWSEQDMLLVWDRVCDAVREAVNHAGTIEAVAITAQGDGCWLVDAAGNPNGPAMLWNDARASDRVAAWARNGTMVRGYALNGSVTFPGLANALLHWMQENQPARLSRSAYALTCGSWIFYKATGDIRAELSDACAPFVDAQALRHLMQPGRCDIRNAQGVKPDHEHHVKHDGEDQRKHHPPFQAPVVARTKGGLRSGPFRGMGDSGHDARMLPW
mgnify:CR=1 FL=1